LIWPVNRKAVHALQRKKPQKKPQRSQPKKLKNKSSELVFPYKGKDGIGHPFFLFNRSKNVSFIHFLIHIMM
jgi:hypothetical protein